MAKLAEGIHFTGTIGNVIYYEMNDRTYARTKGTLSRKRVLKSKAFEKTRKYASDLGRAAQIGSVIYKALPGNIRERWLYRAITGEAASLLYKGKEEQEVQDLLWKKYITDTECAKESEQAIKDGCVNVFPSTREVNIKIRELFSVRWAKQGKSAYWYKRAWQKRGYFNSERFRAALDEAVRLARRE